MTRRLLVLLFILTVLASPAGAQSAAARYDSSTFAGLQWRNIGPDRGGRSLAAAGSAGRPLEYYFGAVGGGLWKTTDAGTTWNPVTDGFIKSSSVGAVAVAESNPDVVYIGMGEVQVQRNLLQGDGVYRSRDAGRTWTHVGLAESQVISRVRVHPGNPDIVFAAAFGHSFGPNEERGVYRSKDAGATWQRVLYRNDHTGAVDLAMDRSDPNLLFAAMWDATLLPGSNPGPDGPASGLFKSTDGGDTWTEITRNPGLPAAKVGKIGVAIGGPGAARIYALVDAEDGGLFSSDDRGATWTKVSDNGAIRQRPSYFNRIAADPTDKDVVYAFNLSLFRSSDGGRTFRTMPSPHADHHDLWIAPNDSRRMIVSTDGGGSVSVSGGETWTEQDYPTAQFYNVATTRDTPYHVCGPQQDASAICVPSSQAPWRSVSPYVGSGGFSGPVYAPGSGEFGMIAPHPTDAELFFATGPNVITRYDRRTGLSQTREIHVSPVPLDGAARERFAVITPIEFSRAGPPVLYTASQHLWKTADGGNIWTRISPDLTVKGAQSGTGSIFAIGPSHHEPSTVFTGSDRGVVYVTRDGGASWRDVTPPEMPSPARISMIATSPHRNGTAFVAVKRFEYDDRAPYIFRTDDHGTTWEEVVGGLPAGEIVHAVREDPKKSGLLYAGTEHGVWISFDGGEQWQSLSLNLPATPVPDLEVEEHDLVIGTHGRSFYVLDGIDPLRQLTPQVVAAPVHLFQPADVIRRLTEATIDYHLRSPAQRVSIELLDGQGQVIRAFESAAAGAGSGGGGGGRGRASPTRRAGLNRFTWDLRYADATVFPGIVLWVGSANGPMAAPGTYRVRLTVDGTTTTQPLRVVRDPRPAALTDADIQEQFTLALRIRDRITDANEGVIRIRALREQVNQRVEAARDAEVTRAAEALLTPLAEVEGELYQVKLRSQLDAVTYPIRINNLLANLKLAVETGDGRPTAQAYDSFEKLSTWLDAQLGKLSTTLGAQLPALNRLLEARRLAPVAVPQRPIPELEHGSRDAR